MKTAERIVMVLLLLVIFGGGVWLYFVITEEDKEFREAIARGDFETPIVEVDTEIPEEEWQRIYPATVPITIGKATVVASVADSLPERIKGLSDTPFLPEGVVKLFVFGAEGSHSIWMKDMNYALDIMWVSKDGKIVHIEEQVSPETYPKSFSSPVSAWYVIEANAGFVAREEIRNGDVMTVVIE